MGDSARIASCRRPSKGSGCGSTNAGSGPAAGIGALTLYAFSSDNWKRPPEEVSALMQLLEQYLQTRIDECVAEGRAASRSSAGATG